MHDLPPLSIIDVLALVLIFLGTLRGLRCGLSGEIAGLAGALTAIIVGFACYEPVSRWTFDHAGLGGLPAHALALALTAIAALLALLLARRALAAAIRLVVRADFDRAAGAVTGLLSSTAIMAIVFLVAHRLPADSYLHRKLKAESAIGTIIARLVPHVEDEAVTPAAAPG